MVKDVWGHEIKNGDFVVCASKSEGKMVMGVIVDVDKQTRIRVDKDWRTNKWIADDKPAHMFTLERTLVLSDEEIYNQAPELFDIMNDVREKVQLRSTRQFKAQLSRRNEALARILASKI